MKIEIYSRQGCIHCDNTKKILNSKNIEFKEYKIDEDISVSQLKLLFPKATMLPIIIIDGKQIEHLSEIRQYI